MSKEIVIVGGLEDGLERTTLLSRLADEVGHDCSWEWISCGSASQFQPPDTAIRRILGAIAQRRNAAIRAGLDRRDVEMHVVKLVALHPRSESLLYRNWSDPIPAPADARTADALIAWLVSPDSDLFPRVQWDAGATGAALVAILAKLIANSSFNPDVSGHNWTKEHDLLGQSPVDRPGFSRIAREARKILSGLDGKLLLTKGSGQGKTPKEWSISTKAAPAIKRCIIAKSFSPISAIPSMAGILAKIAAETAEFSLDEIVSERVRAECRDRRLTAPAPEKTGGGG